MLQLLKYRVKYANRFMPNKKKITGVGDGLSLGTFLGNTENQVLELLQISFLPLAYQI
jgi:hypothetical protein